MSPQYLGAHPSLTPVPELRDPAKDPAFSSAPVDPADMPDEDVLVSTLVSERTSRVSTLVNERTSRVRASWPGYAVQFLPTFMFSHLISIVKLSLIGRNDLIVVIKHAVGGSDDVPGDQQCPRELMGENNNQ